MTVPRAVDALRAVARTEAQVAPGLRGVVALVIAVVAAMLGATVSFASIMTPATVVDPVTNVAPPDASAFRAVTPCRAADTRSQFGFGAIGVDRVRVVIAGRCAVPETAVAAAVTVTVVSAAQPGFVTAWPAGEPLPEVSNVNVLTGEVRANGAIVRLGVDGAIDVRSSTPADLLVDVTGWFEPVEQSADGRFVPMAPLRALDTRRAGGPLVAGATVIVPLPPGVPPDAVALAVNVTTTAPNEPGYVVLHRAGDPRPETSVLNTDRSDQTRAASSIAPVDAGGLAVHTYARGHVIVDVTGWFTGPTAPVSGDGRFVPLSPRRVVDTRSGDPVWAGGATVIPPVEGAAALAVNMTLVGADEWNFASAFAVGTPPPPTSTVNVNGRDDVAANLALLTQSDLGTAVAAFRRGDVLADLAGWFTGVPVAGNGVVPPNVRPPACATDTSPGAVSALFRSDLLFHGADYQRTTSLPDGRVLWLFQDVFVPTRHGPYLLHNAGAVQDGACFHLRHGGTYAAPQPLLLGSRTIRFSQWFWPLASELGADGALHVFLAEMHERSPRYLGRTEPTATWTVRLDPVSLGVLDERPAADPSAALYGWSIVSHGDHTYLYAQCHRQFGWDLFVFSDPALYAHDFSCSARVHVARVPRGQLWRVPEYWDGTAWVRDRARAVPVIPTGDARLINPTQVHHDGTRFVAVTKEGDWWGDTVFIDVAPAAQGPWRTVARFPVAPECDSCNTYFASFVDLPTPSQLVLGLSNNSFAGDVLRRYHPVLVSVAI